ncbi:TPA: hypothetical protein ACQ39K_000552 [Yersinia enterocolitica]
MLKQYRVSGYAVNKRGNTMGIYFDVKAIDIDGAQDNALRLAVADGYRYIRITRTTAEEVTHG